METLGKRNWRNSEIKCTEYPDLLREFCFRDENSRAVPGLETISVGRNLPRKPKRLFNRSREEFEILRQNTLIVPSRGELTALVMNTLLVGCGYIVLSKLSPRTLCSK